MAEPGKPPVSRLDFAVLLARDYGASSHNDHMHWFISNLLESKIAASLEDDNLFVLHAQDALGASFGLCQMKDESYLSTLGYGALYKEAMVQRSAKQVLATGNVTLLDLTTPESPITSISLPSVMRVPDSAGTGAYESASTNEWLLAKDLPLGIVSTKTKVSILACKYRMVFTLDASPSMASVDPITGEVLFDQLYFGLECILTALVQPIRFGNIELTPQIHASFLLQGSHAGVLHVMLHGTVVSQQTLSSTLHRLKLALISGETSIIAKTNAASVASAALNPSNPTQAGSQQVNGTFLPTSANGLPSGSVPQLPSSTPIGTASMNFPMADLGSPLKNAMFILKMLPLDACPAIILLSDGVTMLPEESEAYDSLLMLMRREDIVCSAIRVGSSFRDFTSFAYVPDADFLRHFVSCTGGAYFELPLLLEEAFSDGEKRPNIKLQKSLLFRTPVGESVRPKLHSHAVEFGDLGSDQVDHPYPWEGQAPRQSLYNIPFRQYQLIGVNVLDLLACRYREGFTLHKCLLDGQSPSELSIKLVLPWKELIFICYTIKATYYNDIPNGTPEIQVALDVLAYYDVQMQWSHQQRGSSSSAPTALPLIITKLQQFIFSIIDTDKKLNALSSQTISLNEIIGRSLQTPLHVQIEKAFWKHLAQLPKNVWHRWFKMDRMEIILSSDLLLNTAATAMANASGSRIELRIRAEDLISHHGTSAASTTLTSASGRDSFSQTGMSNLVFRFDTATKELQSYFENWSCFSGSKHSFARVLEHTVITGSNTSQIIASITSKSDTEPPSKSGASMAATKPNSEARTLTVPAYCVVRMTWESKNAAMLTFYFFGVSSADRYKITSGLYSDLMSRTNPNDPSTNLFHICRKPLRYSLVRYNMGLLKDMMGPTDNVPTILSNILPSLLSASISRSVSRPAVSGPVSSSGSTSAPPPLLSQGSVHHTEGSSSRLSSSAQQMSPGDPSPIIYSTEDVNLKALASFSPIYHLLVQYMNHKRWIWNINSEVTQEAAIEALVRCRLNEGFLLVANAESAASSLNAATGIVNTSPASRHLLHSFFKEIRVSSDPKSPSLAQTCVVQYLIYHTPQGYLITELWIEPVHGSIVSLDPSSSEMHQPPKSAFEQLKRLIYDVDLHVISTIFTFDTLSLLHNPHTTRDILSVPTEVKEYQLDSSLATVTVQRPPFNLKGLANVAVQHEEHFTGFEKDDNSVLHQCLHASLSYICDRQLPNKGTFAVGESNPPVFAKAIPNSPEILLVTLHPLSASSSPSSWNSAFTSSSSGNSTPSFSNTPTQARSGFKSSLPGSTTSHLLPSSLQSSSYSPSSSGYVPPPSEQTESAPVPQTLVVTVYQCSRVVEPPKGSTDSLRALLGTLPVHTVVEEEIGLPTVAIAGDIASGVATSASTSSAIHHLCEMIQSEHHRGFVKVLYQRLQKGKASELTPRDHLYALQVCQEYMMELDLTQFFRILAKYSSHEEEILRRRGGVGSLQSLGSYGSDSSSPLDASYSGDTSLLFDRILAHQFRRVPNTEAHFYLAPHGSSASSVPDSEMDGWETDSDATGLSLDEDVAVHIMQSPANDEYESQGEETEDLDDWIDDLSKRYRSAAFITSTNASAGASATVASQQAQISTTNQVLALWSSLPLFIRMECAIMPKPGASSVVPNAEASHHSSHWGSEFTPEGVHHQSRSQPRRDSPGGFPHRSQLRPPNSPYDSHSNLDRDPLLNITTFPISTLPNPKQISALQQLSTTGNRALIRVYAIVLPRHGEGNLYEGSSPMDMANSPISDGTSPLSSGVPILTKDSSNKGGAPQYSKLPKVFRRTFDLLKAAIRSLTAQKSLDILRLRVPVNRAIADIVSLCMRQLNPNALITVKIPLLFIEPQLGISLFFTEFPRWSLQPIRVIDRTLFLSVSPSPSVQFFTQPLSIATSTEYPGSSNLLSSAPASDGYSVPYWLFMSPSSTHVHIRFQSPPGLLKKTEKEEILEKTRENIQFVCKRINQILLLTQLYDHRVCNVLLVNDPDGAAKTTPDSETASSNSTRIPSHPATPKLESPRSSKPISIPSRDYKDKKRIDRAGDEEGIFEHDSEETESNSATFNSPSIPDAPRLPPVSTHDSPLRSLASISRSSPVTFLPGQFACEKVHELHLPLNWRTDPKTILNAIANTVLVHFSVNNRSKMYVYREQSGKIFYMTLSITSALDEPDIDGEAVNEDRSTVGNTSAQGSGNKEQRPGGVPVTSSIAIASKDSDAEPSAMDLVTSSVVSNTTSSAAPSGNLVRSREGSKPSTTFSGNETNWLTLRVYGIDAPSEEITVQLRNTLETRLAHFTLQVISSMLLRNPLMRIKPADELFLRPPEAVPRRFQIELPSFITDISLFRAFVKANLLKQGLTLLNLETDSSGTATAGAGHRGGGGRTPEMESLLATPQTPSVAAASAFSTVSSLYGDAGYVYLYNSVAGSGVVPGGKASALNFGAGLATLSVTIQSPYGAFPHSVGDESSIGSQSSYEAGSAPLFEPISLEDSPMHDIFLSVLSSSEIQLDNHSDELGFDEDLIPGAAHKRRSSKGQQQNEDLSTFVDIKVWIKGSIEVQKIIEHMEKIVNQTIAEYQFEWYAYLAEARENSPLDYNQFICDAQRLLEHAYKLDTPSVRTLNVPVNVQSWAIPGYLKELQKRFLELNADSHPDIYYMDIYNPPGSGTSSMGSNHTFGASDMPQMLGRVDLSKHDFLATHAPASASSASLAASHGFGLLKSSFEHSVCQHDATVGLKHSGWRPYEPDSSENPASQMFFRSSRRFSLLCTKDSLISAWNPKLSSLKVGRDTLASRSVVARSLASSSTGNLHASAAASQLMSERPDGNQLTRSFVILFLDASSQLQLFAYNWTASQMELMAQHVLRDTNFLNLRQNLVGNILHQKMGLFFHNAPMVELTTTSPSFSGPPSLSALSYRSSPQLSKLTRFLPPPCLHASAAPVESASTSNSTSIAVQASPLVIRYTFDNLDYLSQTSVLPSTKRVKDDEKSILSPSSSSKDLSIGSTPGSPAPSKLGKRRAILQKLNDLKIDEILHRISPMVPLSFQADPVFRHAMQFINISERYLRSHQIQQTLLQIYNQWSKRNAKRVLPSLVLPVSALPIGASATNPIAVGSQPSEASNSAGADEKGFIDSNQLSILIRCARLFHTVKIPFFLTDVFLKEDLFEGPTTITHAAGVQKNLASDASKPDTTGRSPVNSHVIQSEDRPPTMRLVPIFPTSAGEASSPTSSASILAPPPTAIQPFLYSAGETTQRVISRPELNLRFEPSSHPRERQLKYRQFLLNQFLDQFVTYLATFGVTPVHVKPAAATLIPSSPITAATASTSSAQSSSAGATPNSTPLNRVSHSLSPSDTSKESPLTSAFSSGSAAQPVSICPPKQQRYLQKVFRGGLILFEVEGGGAENGSVSCNVFTLFFNRLTAHFGASEDVIGARSTASLRHLAHFTREIANIKTQLHMNSFVYDFHVRHISQLFANAPSLANPTASMNTKSEDPANARDRAPASSSNLTPATPVSVTSSLPTVPPVEIINQLQAMAIYYEHPPKHSRTAIATSHISIDVTNALLSPLELFAYATKHAKHFGFQPTDWGLTPGVACMAKSSKFHVFPLEPSPELAERNGATDESSSVQEEDSWIMLAFMSHTSDATSATNQAISMSLAGGHVALESNYNACYRVARQKHLAAMTLQSQQLSLSEASHSLPELPSTSPASPSQPHNPSNSMSSMKVTAGDPAMGLSNGGTLSSASNLHTSTGVMSASSSIVNLSSPLRGKLPTTSSGAPKPVKHLTLSFFVLRVPKHTIFPLRASTFATPPPMPHSFVEGAEMTGNTILPPEIRPVSPLLGESGSIGAPQPPPTSLAAYNRRNMSDALHNCRNLLRDVANRCVVESERDVLWSKLVADNAPSSADFLNSDQLAQMLKLAYSRSIDLLDPTLTSMTSGITTDWKYIMNQISTAYSSFYKTRVFLAEADQQPHLLIFNPGDTDLLIHLSIPDPKRIEALCVRRELNPSLEQKHAKLESIQISHLVNTICHLLWKHLLPKPVRR